MSDEIFDVYRHQRQVAQQLVSEYRAANTLTLIMHGIHFTSRNDGMHLIVNHANGSYDVWPSTGRWMQRGVTKVRHGIDRMISHHNTPVK